MTNMKPVERQLLLGLKYWFRERWEASAQRCSCVGRARARIPRPYIFLRVRGSGCWRRGKRLQRQQRRMQEPAKWDGVFFESARMDQPGRAGKCVSGQGGIFPVFQGRSMRELPCGKLHWQFQSPNTASLILSKSLVISSRSINAVSVSLSRPDMIRFSRCGMSSARAGSNSAMRGRSSSSAAGY